MTFSKSSKQLAMLIGGILLAVAVCMAMATVLTTKPFAILVNGKQIATLPSEDTANTVVASYLKETAEEYEKYDIDIRYKEDIQVVPAAEGSRKMSREGAKKALADSCTVVTDGAAIIVDGQPRVYMANRLDATKTLEYLKLSYIPDDSTMQVLETKYTENVQIAETEVNVRDLKNTEEAKLALKGDNPQTAPIHVQVILEKTRTEEVPFEVVYKTDNSLRYGVTKTKQEGANGSREVTIQMVQTNGEETARQEISSNTLVEAVDEVILQGALVQTAARSTTYLTSAGMIWPTTTTRISSNYGERRGHSGVDIDGEYGDPVWAAKDGTVVSAGYNGTYGNEVVIDHGDNLKTRYAHMQTICVKSGDKVTVGDKIGEEGSTGNSTGSHLHFEVILNGRQVNPMSYIK